MGTKKRLEKLLKSGTIKISALINPSTLKLHPAIVMLEMESAEAMQDLLKRFEECPRVIQIFKTIGGYNLIALVVAETRETLESISMEKCSLRSDKGIRRSEFYPIRDIHHSPYVSIRERFAHRNLSSPPCNVDCRTCLRYEDEECVRCPATEYYRGSL